MGSFRSVAFGVAAIVFAAVPAAASGSQLIDRNANGITLSISNDGKALLTYTDRGQLKRTLAIFLARQAHHLDRHHHVLQHRAPVE